MAYAQHEDFQNAILGKTDVSNVVTLSGSGGGTPVGQSAAPDPGTVESTTAPVQSSAPAGDGLGYGSGGFESTYFDPISQGLIAGQEGLGGAVDTFYQNAGADRTWETSGGEDTLQSFISGTGDEAAAVDYVNAAYTGPQNLDFTPDQDLMTRAKAMTTGSGMTGIIQASDPGLTPGMARFDAKDLWSTPGYKQTADTYKSQVDDYYQDIAKAEADATAKAAARTEQESGIREESRNFVNEAYDTTGAELDAKVAEENARNQAIQEQYIAATEGGLSEEEQKALGLWTPVSEDASQASQLRAEIDAKYEDIGHIPVGELSRDWKGHELTTFTVGDETFSIDDMYKGKMPKAAAKEWGVETLEEQRALADRLSARQRELEGSFASPTYRDERYGGAWPGYDQENGPYQHRSMTGFGLGDGEYAAYDPLYFQEVTGQPTSQMPDPMEYLLSPDEMLSDGSTLTATRENIATDEQRAQLERIETLLPELKGLSDAGMTFEAARIGAEYEQFLDAQEAALEARGGQLDEASETWRDQVQAARNAYTNAKKKEAWGTVLTVAGGVLGGPLFWAGGAVTGRAAGNLL